MIESIQSSKGVVSKTLNNFKGNDKKLSSKSDKSFSKKNSTKDSNLQAAEIKYNLACLWAATTQLENAKLKQELASAIAEKNYYKACC